MSGRTPVGVTIFSIAEENFVRKTVFVVGAALAAALLLASGSARASFLSGEALDTAADVLAVVVLIVVPIAAIVVFWLVHILPEVIAAKRHHPQKDAITTLCLLSLVFGGMLWPIAWLWAYTRPVGYRMAYGTDKHEHYFEEMGGKARAGTLLKDELAHLREELDSMAARGTLPPSLKDLRAELDELHSKAVAPAAAAPAPARKEG
jgi:CBS domain containing-hemolysin-like protein